MLGQVKANLTVYSREIYLPQFRNQVGTMSIQNSKTRFKQQGCKTVRHNF